ncbi:MAG: RICIN domain-containing protein, partial [Actinomycetota bacterium]
MSEYLILFALIVTASSATMIVLENNAEEFLTESSASIGQPRGLRQDLGINPADSLPPWLTVPPPPTSGYSTYVPTADPSEEGTLISARHSGLCLGNRDERTFDGTFVEHQGCTSGAHQRWRPEEVSAGTFRIRHQATGKCLDLADGATGDGAKVQIWECNGGPSQQLQITAHPSGGFRFTWISTGDCVEIRDELMVPGAEAQQSSCDDADNQAFDFSAYTSLATTTSIPPPPFWSNASSLRIKPRGSDLCLEVPDVRTERSVQLAAGMCVAGLHQRWSILENTTGYHEFRAAHSNLCLNVPTTPAMASPPVNQFDCSRLTNQQVELEDHPAGGFRFILLHDDEKCVEMSAGLAFFRECSGSSAQAFDIEPWPTPPFGNQGDLQLRTRGSSRCIQVGGRSWNFDAPINEYDCTGYTHQRWQIFDVGNGLYDVKVRHTNYCASAQGSGTGDGTRLVQGGCSFNLGQLFGVSAHPAGGWRFSFGHTGKCLEARGGGFEHRPCSSSAAQSFEAGGWPFPSPPIYRRIRKDGTGSCIVDGGGLGSCDSPAARWNVGGSYSSVSNGLCWVAGVPPTTTTDPDASSVPPPPPGSFGVAGCSGGSDQQFSHGGSGELRVA